MVRETLVVGFDGSLSKDKAPGLEEIKAVLNEHCKAWVFQLEEGDGGYVHYQIRVRMKNKMRLSTLKKNNFLPTCHWGVTSSEVAEKKDFNYVTKIEGRLDGPWKNTDIVGTLTSQLREFMTYEMYPWQKTMLDLVQERDHRAVDVIIDIHGNAGKSIFAEYLEYRRLAFDVPPMRAMEDIMQCVMALPKLGAYLIDMPRAMKKDKLADFYAGIESLKNGRAYDKRYEYRFVRFDRPRVFVFTNCEPDYSLLSRDRWRVWLINDKKEMVPGGWMASEARRESEAVPAGHDRSLDKPQGSEATASAPLPAPQRAKRGAATEGSGVDPEVPGVPDFLIKKTRPSVNSVAPRRVFPEGAK